MRYGLCNVLHSYMGPQNGAQCRRAVSLMPVLIWLVELTCVVLNILPTLQACEGFSFYHTDKIQLLLFIFLTAKDTPSIEVT